MHIAEDPLLCVVNGCGQVLEDWKRFHRVVDTPEFVRAAAGIGRDGSVASVWEKTLAGFGPTDPMVAAADGFVVGAIQQGCRFC